MCHLGFLLYFTATIYGWLNYAGFHLLIGWLVQTNGAPLLIPSPILLDELESFSVVGSYMMTNTITLSGQQVADCHEDSYLIIRNVLSTDLSLIHI